MSICQTKNGKGCEFPFWYNDRGYAMCIDVDNGGVPWCYTNLQRSTWGNCNISSCPVSRGELNINSQVIALMLVPNCFGLNQ